MHGVLKGKQAPARWTGRGKAACQGTEHEATWPRAPKSDLENVVNGVKVYLFPVTSIQASLTPPNACDIYKLIRLVGSYHTQ